MSAIDISSQRFGRLVAIRPTDQRRGRSIVWECYCDCGNTHFVPVKYLRNGSSKSCGCLKEGPRDDLSGRVFGRLTVIGPTDDRILDQVAWDCLCSCGNHHLVCGSALKRGNTSSCGCLQKERQHAAVALPEGEAAFNRLYRSYKRSARKRGLAFNIRIDEFKRLTSQNCVYCGSGPSNAVSESQLNGSYIYNGLDRVNSDIGYEPENVVPCCKHCNTSKNSMTKKGFAEHIVSVYNHWAKNFID